MMKMIFSKINFKTIQSKKKLQVLYKGDSELFRKVVLINVVCLIGIVTLIPMGLLAFWQSNLYLGCIDFLVAVLLLFTLIYLNRTQNTTISGYIGIAGVAIFFWFLVVTGGVNNTAFVWMYTFPLFAMFLLGSNKGLLINVLFFIPIALFLIIAPQAAVFTTYPFDLKMRIIPSFIVVLGYSYLFEFMREKSYTKLQAEVKEHRITAKKLHEAKIASEKANQAKSDFLANMSHELRTPLNHIIGFTELVLAKHFGDLNEIQEEYLTDVHQSGGHLLDLINDILDIAKVEAGKATLNLSPVNLRVLLENSLSIVKEKAKTLEIRLSTDIGRIPDVVILDERKMKQIMYNLLSNAVKFTNNQGQVVVKARMRKLSCLGEPETDKKGDLGIHISVIDNGIGLKDMDTMRIFNPFEQAEISTKREFHSTGLGLALTKNFVEMHGGNLSVRSDGENQGANFSLIIPIDPSRRQSTDIANKNKL